MSNNFKIIFIKPMRWPTCTHKGPYLFSFWLGGGGGMGDQGGLKGSTFILIFWGLLPSVFVMDQSKWLLERGEKILCLQAQPHLHPSSMNMP